MRSRPVTLALVLVALVLVALPAAVLAVAGDSPITYEPAAPAKAATVRLPPPPAGPLPGEDISTAIPVPGMPFEASGNTCGYADDYDEQCPYGGSLSPDVVYAFTPWSDVVLAIDLCESGYDTKVYVYENDVSNLVACNDDACGSDGYRSELWLVLLTSGQTYYIVVDGYGGDCGDYVLRLNDIVPEILECPAGAVIEGEPDCYDGYDDQFNSGCAAVPGPVFTPLFGTPNGDPYDVCGTAGTFTVDGLNFRDTDWYEFVVTEENTVTFTCSAMLPVQILLIDGNTGCANPAILAVDQAGLFPDVAMITHTFAPGTYWFWVGPSVFSGVECGSLYTFRVEGLTVVPTSVGADSWAGLKSLYR